MDQTRVEHLEELQLIDHPLQHGHSAVFRSHHLNSARDLEQVVELVESGPVQHIYIYRWQLANDHLLQADLLRLGRRLRLYRAAADANILRQV